MKSSLYLLALIPVAARLCSAFQPVPFGGHPTRTSHRVFLSMSQDPAAAEKEPVVEAVDPTIVCPNCDMCDGSGRIAGGIGAVFPWIPIKAYRPCPNFVERGGQYQRAGQGLDEIAFGKKSNY